MAFSGTLSLSCSPHNCLNVLDDLGLFHLLSGLVLRGRSVLVGRGHPDPDDEQGGRCARRVCRRALHPDHAGG